MKGASAPAVATMSRIFHVIKNVYPGILTPTLLFYWILMTSSVNAQSTAGGAPPIIWFHPVTDQVTPAGFLVDQDFMQLFTPNAPWQNALSRIHVFEIVRRYIMTQPDSNLQKIFTFLHDRHIELAIDCGMVPANGCGDGIEGMVNQPNANLAMATRLKKLGADVKYIVMDEPLTFGHYSNKPNACHYPIPELAVAVVGEIRKVRSVFRDAIVIEDEAHSGIGSPDELGQWLDALKAQLGDGAPQAIRFDVQWESPRKPWRQYTPPLVATVLRHGYRYGIIFDGTPQDSTDEAWIHTAQENIRNWEKTIRWRPDHVMIQSWHRHPQQLLPETSPTTLPYLINWYSGNSDFASGR